MGLKEQMQKKAEELDRAKALARTPKFTVEEKNAKYFKTLLPESVSSAQKRIRILPPIGTEDIFQEGYFHNIRIPGYGNGKTKIYDPGKNDGQRSPITEVGTKLYSLGTDEAKKLAKEYYSSKYYIIRVIDRDNEQDGVKFWRFPHKSKGDGVFDKILNIVNVRGDIDDPNTGRDLILTLTKVSNGIKWWTECTGVIDMDPSPLHSDPEVVKEWMSDTLTWRDLYLPKSLEYLEIVAEGKTPKWDKELNKFVPSEDLSAKESVSFGAPSVMHEMQKPILKAESTLELPDPQMDDEPDEDLPF